MRERWFVLVVVLACGVMMAALQSSAEKAPRFVVGHTYQFAIDCNIRVGVGQDPDSGVRVPIDIGDCYMEPLQVKKVLDDGWLEVIDIRNPKIVWTVNPARVWGFAHMQNPHERQASR